ncbi:hypothetical protein [Halomonas sp. WWR20]
MMKFSRLAVVLLAVIPLQALGEPAFSADEGVGTNPELDEATRQFLMKEAEVRRECQLAVELWRSDWESGIGRWNDGVQRPWGKDVAVLVEPLGEHIRQVADPTLQARLLDGLEDLAKEHCFAQKTILDLLMSQLKNIDKRH